MRSNIKDLVLIVILLTLIVIFILGLVSNVKYNAGLNAQCQELGYEKYQRNDYITGYCIGNNSAIQVLEIKGKLSKVER